MSVFESNSFDDHQRVVFCHDKPSGLRAIIAIHSTALGPAAGGCRIWHYDSDEEALRDALRLSKGMSFKNAMAGLALGGGKAVILADGTPDKSDPLLEAFGEFVDKLNGDYITAEDVGMSVADMEVISRRTRFVSGLPQQGTAAGGDPSPKTARGVYRGIRAAARFRLGRDDLQGLKIAVQGVGSVGYYLCRHLHEDGVELLVSDVDAGRVQRAREEFGATPVAVDDILFEDVDVIAPCALGGIFDGAVIPQLRASIIAGGANNQLAEDRDGELLRRRDILYAPDYVINAGGIINVACEFLENADEAVVQEKVDRIGPRLEEIFRRSSEQQRPTNVIADELARARIAAGPNR